ERGLRIDREHQHPMALVGQPEGGRSRECRFAEAALAAEHDVTAVPIAFECFFERHGCDWRYATIVEPDALWAVTARDSEHGVGDVLLAEHTPLPGGDVGDDVGKQAE